MFEDYHELCDVVSILVKCSDDNTFLIVEERNTQEYWIPSSKIGENKSWKATAKRLLDEVKLSGKIDKVCQIVRVWNPLHNEMIHHVVYIIHVSRDVKQRLCSPVHQKGFWANTNEIQTNYQKLRSPELLVFISTAQGTPLDHPKLSVERMNIKSLSSWSVIIGTDNRSEVVEILEHNVFLRDETTHRKVMDSVGYTESVQASMFTQYLVYCFPCTYMNIRIFGNILEKLGWERGFVHKLYNTADVEARGFLSYRDFLYIIAIADPNMKHGTGATEIRSRYIFRYYDVNNDKLLDYNEMKAIFHDVRQSKVKSPETAYLSKDLETCGKLLGIDAHQPTDSDKFVKTLTMPRLKGTSVLLRSSRTITLLVPTIRDDYTSKNDIPVNRQSTQISHQTSRNPLRKLTSDYSVAVHCIKLKKNGTLIDKIWSLERVMSGTSLLTSKDQLCHSLSMESFNHTNVHFEVLRGLEYFEKEVTPKEAAIRPGKRPKAAFNWGLVDPSGFAKCVMKVCNAVTPLLKGEPRLLELISPVYVLGDLHGCFTDLMRFEKALWPLGPTLSPTTLLVLGDYVDRGPHSIEIIAYLFAYKLQSPHKVMLLRGNHEIRAIQKLFTFQQECRHKFGDKLGDEVWEAVNATLDCLPLAALIDGKVFCTHGGIPPPWLCPTVAAINSVPCPLPRPDEQSPLAWDLMWNDPIKPGDIPDSVQLEVNANDGFAANYIRGTGHFFTADALANFLKINDLSILLRAHQMQQNGFFVQMRNKMETVFSASNYGNSYNEAACVLVDCGKLRAYRVDLTPTPLPT